MEGRQERNWVRGAPTRGKGLAEGQGENGRGVWGGLEAAVMGGGKQGVRDGALGPLSRVSPGRSLAKCISGARGKTRG